MSSEKRVEKEWLENLYRKLFQRLFLSARTALQNECLAEEAVQDTFVIACKKIDKVADSENPAGWLMNTLKNVISNMKRSRGSLYYYMTHMVGFDRISNIGRPDEVNVDILYHGMVNAENFSLLKYIVLGRYSYLEAAQRFGITVEACKKRVQRTKKKMRTELEKT